jgi:hypothetical protein
MVGQHRRRTGMAVDGSSQQLRGIRYRVEIRNWHIQKANQLLYIFTNTVDILHPKI